MHPCFDKMIRIVAPFYRPASLWVNSTQSVDDNSRYRLESQLSGGQRELCVREGTRTLLALCYDFCMLYSFECMHYHYVCVRLCVWAWSLTDLFSVVVMNSPMIFTGWDGDVTLTGQNLKYDELLHGIPKKFSPYTDLCSCFLTDKVNTALL